MKAGDLGDRVPEAASRDNFETLENLKMKSTSVVLAATLAGAMALPFALQAAAQSGPTPAPVPEFKFEKCYGVVKAGSNDCQTATSSCAGTSKRDGQADAWIYLPAGTCGKIAGGSSEFKKG